MHLKSLNNESVDDKSFIQTTVIWPHHWPSQLRHGMAEEHDSEEEGYGICPGCALNHSYSKIDKPAGSLATDFLMWTGWLLEAFLVFAETKPKW
ncbi:hypothetical protein AVEN_253899-1 [Araneus ventricosus]|uniref:Uncharacterized protein n=1 Tax=Araneus ventricosus TaxID=182803 RepID=A0A4Y2LV16_ARAVE|nr:hypothetical protein AVEN_253899-1 [Araneus ventricosus]